MARPARYPLGHLKRAGQHIVLRTGDSRERVANACSYWGRRNGVALSYAWQSGAWIVRCEGPRRPKARYRDVKAPVLPDWAREIG